MAKLFLNILFLLCSIFSFCQQKDRLRVEINYGWNGNFFVRSYDELKGPDEKTYLYKKNFIGSAGGIDVKYTISKMENIGVSYSKSMNKGTKNFGGTIDGVYVSIQDFNIRHINDFFQIYYERKFKESYPDMQYHLGLMIINMHQQEIGIENFSSQILIDERNAQNSKLQEAGVVGGIHYSKKIDTRFRLGLKVRGYYLISTQTFEAITLAPTLTYKF